MADGITSRGRSYPFHSVGGSTVVRIDDEVEPLMRHLAKTFPDELNRALRHVGWWLSGEIKRAVRANGPGLGWPARMPRGRHRKLINALRKGGADNRTVRSYPYGARLVRAIGYRHEPARMRVRVGVLSRSAQSIFERLQTGFTRPVTPRMRRLFFGAGLGISTGQVKVPGRPLFDPMLRMKQRELFDRIYLRVRKYLDQSVARARSRALRSGRTTARQLIGRAA